jgi:hypothetical protein
MHIHSSRLVNLLKVIDAPVQVVSDVLVLIVSFKFINFIFQIFLFFLVVVPEMFTILTLILFYLHCVITVDNALHCTIKFNVHQIMSRLQNREGRDDQGM